MKKELEHSRMMQSFQQEESNKCASTSNKTTMDGEEEKGGEGRERHKKNRSFENFFKHKNREENRLPVNRGCDVFVTIFEYFFFRIFSLPFFIEN